MVKAIGCKLYAVNNFAEVTRDQWQRI